MTVTETRSRASSRRWTRHLHPAGSFDVADHPVPTGREEIWRFTPLKRLRGLHADAAARRHRLSAPRYDGARRRRRRAARGRRRPRSGRAASCRPTGSRARVWHERRPALRRDGPGRRRARPTRSLVDAHRHRRRATPSADARRDHAPARTARPPSCCASTAPRRWPTTSRSWSATAPSSTVVSIHDWADDAVHVGHQHAQVGRDATLQARRRHLRRRRGAPRHHRRVRRSRRRGRDARPLLRRRRPAHRAPAVRRPQRAARPSSHVDLQGRAAGPGRPHRLDRQRADPQGRRGHRDLRGEPQPRAHRRLPGRLGARTSRSRPARSRAPATRRRPAASTTSSCSTCARAASPRTRRAAWSCTASSTT